MLTRKFQRCGELFEAASRNIAYCDACREIAKRDNQRRADAKRSPRKKEDTKND